MKNNFCVFSKKKIYKNKNKTTSANQQSQCLYILYPFKNKNKIYPLTILPRHKGTNSLTDKAFQRAKWTFTSLHPWPFKKMYENSVVDTKVKKKKKIAKRRERKKPQQQQSNCENVYAHGQQARIVGYIYLYAFECIYL